MTTNMAVEMPQAGGQLLALLRAFDTAQAEHTPAEIHQIRVAIKRVRAWLKLIRGMSGKSTQYQQVVTALRALSTALSGQRDRDVALHTLTKLKSKYPGKKAEHVIDILTRQFALHPEATLDLAFIAARIEELQQILIPVAQQDVPDGDRIALVGRAYRKMCRAGSCALSSQSCSELHAWRKRVKSLTYQLAMIRTDSAEVHKLTQQLTRLGNNLGKVHDLCFLTTMLEALPVQDDLELAPLYKRISREKTRLLAKVGKRYRFVCGMDWLQHLSSPK
jgi:CHAD domain-containing protein